MGAGLVLDIFVEYLFRATVRLFKRWNARSWMTVTAEIVESSYRRGGIGCAVADVSYEYKVGGGNYSGNNSVPFITDGSAKDYI